MEGRTGGREGEGDRLNALRGSGADSSHWGAGEASAGRSGTPRTAAGGPPGRRRRALSPASLGWRANPVSLRSFVWPTVEQ